MSDIKSLLEKNEDWAEQVQDTNPELFETLSKGQSPEYLWIGCADSRVPPDVIVDLPPGSLFVHRNIANVISASDINALSVIQYAVQVLKVKHMVVCGHYGCGGVKAAMEPEDRGLIEHWLENIRKVYRAHQAELEQISDEQERHDRYCELNVMEQVANMTQIPFVRQAWDAGQELQVHGLIYDLQSGRLKDLQVSVQEAGTS